MTKPPFIEARKIWPLGSVRASGRPARSTGNGQNPTVAASGRPARSTEHLEQRIPSLSVDRCGRPKFPESKLSGAVDRPGRPILQCTLACTSVHVRSTDPVDRPLSVLKNQNCQNQKNGIKDWSFNLIKIPEIHSKSRKIVSIKIKTVFLKICFSKTCFSITSQNTKNKIFEFI